MNTFWIVVAILLGITLVSYLIVGAVAIRVIYDPDLANEYQDVVFVSDLISYLEDKDYR